MKSSDPITLSTLKWMQTGELSEHDKTRIIMRLMSAPTSTSIELVELPQLLYTPSVDY